VIGAKVAKAAIANTSDLSSMMNPAFCFQFR